MIKGGKWPGGKFNFKTGKEDRQGKEERYGEEGERVREGERKGGRE